MAGATEGGLLRVLGLLVQDQDGSRTGCLSPWPGDSHCVPVSSHDLLPSMHICVQIFSSYQGTSYLGLGLPKDLILTSTFL